MKNSNVDITTIEKQSIMGFESGQASSAFEVGGANYIMPVDNCNIFE